MEATERTIVIYSDEKGREPLSEWLMKLKDKMAHTAILVRIDRVRHGNFGDNASVGGDVREMRIDIGPGYRVYYGIGGDEIVLLLCGGTKRTQSKDVEKAKQYWKERKQI